MDNWILISIFRVIFSLQLFDMKIKSQKYAHTTFQPSASTQCLRLLFSKSIKSFFLYFPTAHIELFLSLSSAHHASTYIRSLMKQIEVRGRRFGERILINFIAALFSLSPFPFYHLLHFYPKKFHFVTLLKFWRRRRCNEDVKM